MELQVGESSARRSTVEPDDAAVVAGVVAAASVDSTGAGVVSVGVVVAGVVSTAVVAEDCAVLELPHALNVRTLRVLSATDQRIRFFIF
jgi:hypothetical protein